MRPPRCSFRDLFKNYLEEVIGLGGDVGQLVTLVNVYQGRDSHARSIAFGEWLENEIFVCERCEHEFKADSDVIENDDVLCGRCAAWERGYDEARGLRR